MQIPNKLCLPLQHEHEKEYLPICHFAHADSMQWHESYRKVE